MGILFIAACVLWAAQYAALNLSGYRPGDAGFMIDTAALVEELHPKAEHDRTAFGADLGGDAFSSWGASCVPEKVTYADSDTSRIEIPEFTLHSLARGEGELVVMAAPGQRVVGELRGPALLPLVFEEMVAHPVPVQQRAALPGRADARPRAE